jgi:8-oxo-dGTP pyrophosphatase MutT (NUDIX family)
VTPPIRDAVPIRDAATVALVRDSVGGDGIDIWLMQRQETMAFAAGAHVFPGGSVDAGDAEPLRTRGMAFSNYADVMGVDPGRAQRLVAAAVRETFEEAAVVLASADDGDRPPAWSEADRQALIGGRTSVAALLNRDALAVDLDPLVPWAWWLTPEFVPRRYDTWFFLVDASERIAPLHIGGEEAVDARWWSVHEALEANRDGRIMLMLPTFSVLSDLASHARVGDALAHRPTRLERRAG